MPNSQAGQMTTRKRGVVIAACVLGCLLAFCIVAYIDISGTGRMLKQHGGGSWVSGSVVERLGGPEAAIRKIDRYLRLPGSLVAYKVVGVGALAHCGPGAIPVLVRSMHDADEMVVREAVGVLADSRLRDPRFVRDLTPLLSHDSVSIRTCAAFVLADIGPSASEFVPALRELLDARGYDVRYWPEAAAASYALWRIAGEERDRAVAGLVARLDDSWARKAAVRLGEMGPLAHAAIPGLEAAASSRDTRLKLVASKALSQIRGEVKQPSDPEGEK